MQHLKRHYFKHETYLHLEPFVVIVFQAKPYFSKLCICHPKKYKSSDFHVLQTTISSRSQCYLLVNLYVYTEICAQNK